MNRAGLPEDLRRLHEELASIDCQERASFGPELRAELEAEWSRISEKGLPVGVASRLRRAVRTLATSGEAANPSPAPRSVTKSVLVAIPVLAVAAAAVFRMPSSVDPASTNPNDEPSSVVRTSPGALLLLDLDKGDLTGPNAETLLGDALTVAFPSSNLSAAAPYLLEGSKPPRAASMRWRAFAGTALRRAADESPDNASPLLALARLRTKQGARAEAARLLETALARAREHPHRASPTLVADLMAERGRLAMAGWVANSVYGQIPPAALDPKLCPGASSGAASTAGGVRALDLVAWNYLCPKEFGTLIAADFVVDSSDLSDAWPPAWSYFRSAARIDPAHAVAQVNYLLPLTDAGRWSELLGGALVFLEASDGHPHAHLLAGLALRRLERTEEAGVHLRAALKALPEGQARALTDVSFLLSDSQQAEYRSMEAAGRAEWEADFWRWLAPDPDAAVNEREIEHLARTAHVFLRFGDLACDPAEVWIRYGRPSQVRIVSDDAGYDTEFWDYGAGADATFVRLGPGLFPILTPEGRAYLEELRGVFPHHGANSK